MRRSSSTIRRCGALSAGAACGAIIARVPCSQCPPSRSSASRAAMRLIGALDEFQDPGAIFCVDHGGEKPLRSLVAARAELFERGGDAGGLQARKLKRKRAALVGHVQKPLATIMRTFLLNDITLIDELLEDAAERLLGDAQEVE